MKTQTATMQRLLSTDFSGILSPFLDTFLYILSSPSPLSPPIAQHGARALLWPGQLPDSRSLSVYLGSSSLQFFLLLDISKPWPLSTTWYSSAIKLLTSSIPQSSQRPQIAGSLSLSKNRLAIPPCALVLRMMIKSISTAIYLWKWGSLDYSVMALR